MNRSELITKFILDYNWKPTEEEQKHFQQFCDTTARTDVLAQVLDPMNHPKRDDIMRPQPPKVAALYKIRYDIVKNLNRLAGIDKDANLRSQEKEAEVRGYEQSCKWCIQGTVLDFRFDTSRGFWGLWDIGDCAKCSDGDAVPGDALVAAAKNLKVAVRDLYGPVLLSSFRDRLGGIRQTPEGLPMLLVSVSEKLKRRRLNVGTSTTAKG